MRNALVIGGLVVVALIGGLVWMLGKDDSAAPHTSATGAGSAAAETNSGTPAHPTVTNGIAGDRPALPAPAPGQNPRDYVVGDIRVRDHRAGDNEPLDIPPNPHPAEGRMLPSTLTHEIAQKVRAAMAQCTADVPKQPGAERGRVEGQIIVAIKDKKLTIAKSVMQLRNVSAESVEPAKQCIEQKSIGLETAATDQADLDSYSINVSFAIP